MSPFAARAAVRQRGIWLARSFSGIHSAAAVDSSGTRKPSQCAAGIRDPVADGETECTQRPVRPPPGCRWAAREEAGPAAEDGIQSTSVGGLSGIRIARAKRFRTENRRADCKVAGRFPNMGRAHRWEAAWIRAGWSARKKESRLVVSVLWAACRRSASRRWPMRNRKNLVPGDQWPATNKKRPGG